MLDVVLSILPESLSMLLRNLPDAVLIHIEEVRIRENRPLEVIYAGQYSFVTAQGKLTDRSHSAYMPSRDDCLKLIDLLTNHSLYTHEEELKRGYVTVRGGHRVGLAGRTVLENGAVKQVKEISSFNIRFAREIIDAGKQVLPYLLDVPEHTIHQTLVISPPQQGKTTLVRDLARLISYGGWDATGKGLKVGIIDERSELAGSVKGVPRFDVGPRTDVLDGCPKAEGMMMMIRSMSPDVLVVDEIGRSEDAKAIHEALHAGIRVIATAHGSNPDDVRDRPILRQLIESCIFSRYVVLSRKGGGNPMYTVYDDKGNRISPADLRIPAGRGNR